MTEKDRKLLNQALNLSYINWGKINAMINLADSEKTKESLRAIQRSKYNEEEYSAGVL